MIWWTPETRWWPSDASVVMDRAVRKGKALLGEWFAGQRCGLGGVLAGRVMDIECCVTWWVHRLADRRICLEVTPVGCVADREIVPITDPDAEGAIAATEATLAVAAGTRES